MNGLAIGVVVGMALFGQQPDATVTEVELDQPKASDTRSRDRQNDDTIIVEERFSDEFERESKEDEKRKKSEEREKKKERKEQKERERKTVARSTDSVQSQKQIAAFWFILPGR